MTLKFKNHCLQTKKSCQQAGSTTETSLTGVWTGLQYIIVILTVLSFLSPVWAKTSTVNKIMPKPEHSSQCIKIVRALERYHYLGKKLDNNMSSIILHQYLKKLDLRKQLFTLKDINLFEKYQFRFDDDLRRGRLNPGFKIFNIFMNRSKQRLEYISLLIKTWEADLDFSKDESITIEYDLRRWQTDEQQLYTLWKKELKNHIISLLLDDKKMIPSQKI